MANCPECESPISANDQFCPVCGIALAQVSPPVQTEPEHPSAEPSSEEEFDSTVMMSPEELAALANLKKPIAKSEHDPPPASSSQKQEMIDFGAPAADESTPPAPSILQGSQPTSGNIDIRPTGQIKIEQEKTLENIDQPEILDFGAPAELFNEDTLPPVEIDEPKTLDPAIHETPLLSMMSSPPEEKAPGTPESVEPASVVTANEPVIPVSAEQSTGSESVSESTNVEARPKPASSIEDEPVPEIAKPGFDLPEYQQDNPIYDSVRIVAPEPPSDQDFVNTRIPGSADLRRPAPESRSSADEPRSHTTPNFDAGTSDGRKAAKLKPLGEGAILNNRYEIIRKIGGGGMGAVYLASDNNLGGVLRAVKEMVQAHIEDDQQEKAINDFKRESMILSSLDHPAIPTIFDYFYDDSECRFYLVMKYISGGDLAARIRSAPEGKIDEATVIEWALQIIDVLNYLHNQPSTIVYRDLKPSNIMIDGNSGRVMLIDFGIARSISQKEEKGVTAVGTMGYAPPELFSGNVEPRSDIYSLGSTMFHLLTGADPQSNPLLIFDFQKNPRPRQINPRLSDQIERILMKAVEYSADSRFASAAEMRQVLEQHLAGLKSGNVTYGVGEIPASVALADQTVFCGFCGQRIVATDMFCAFCGSRQPIAQQGVHLQAVAHKAAVTAKLLIEGTSELSIPAFALQKEENLLGRRDPMSNIFPEVDLSKYDPQTKISRRHARIWKQGDSFLVEDLGSSNGTMLTVMGSGTMRLTPHKPQLLTSGDRIKLGDTTLHFVVD